MISATAGTSASAVAAAPSFSEQACPPSRADLPDPDALHRETCPTLVCACVGIHYLRPLLARRCRLAAVSCVPFSARSFLVHGETSAAAAKRWTAAPSRRDSASRTRQVLTFRGSPSPANYACLFLPLPLLSSHLRPPPLRAAVVLFPPSVALPPRFFSHLLSLPSLLHAPIFSSSPPPSSSITRLRSPSSCFALVPTSYISSSV